MSSPTWPTPRRMVRTGLAKGFKLVEPTRPTWPASVLVHRFVLPLQLFFLLHRVIVMQLSYLCGCALIKSCGTMVIFRRRAFEWEMCKMRWQFWRGKKRRATGPEYYPPVELAFAQARLPSPANDNCFFKWMFGPIRPFETASSVRKLQKEVLADPDYFLADKVRLLDHGNTFLALFRAVYVDDDLEKAKALAPRLNRHVPELMARCPIKMLRPDWRAD